MKKYERVDCADLKRCCVVAVVRVPHRRSTATGVVLIDQAGTPAQERFFHDVDTPVANYRDSNRVVIPSWSLFGLGARWKISPVRLVEVN